MERKLEKATAFITRRKDGESQLLLFKHPNAGIQLPAGTVEEGESPEKAVLREAMEETGLDKVIVKSYIGCMKVNLPEDKIVVSKSTKVYARPDYGSFDWAQFRRGITIEDNHRQLNGFRQVVYKENDDFLNPEYVTYSILGWVPDECIAKEVMRYLYHLEIDEETGNQWENVSDNHVFTFFWSSLSELPELIYPQNEWLTYALEELKYKL